jgi:hypothetical protein
MNEVCKVKEGSNKYYGGIKKSTENMYVESALLKNVRRLK